MSRSCVCGGSNENCRFCNGSGILPDHLDSFVGRPVNKVEPGAMGKTNGHVGSEDSQIAQPPLILCPKDCKLLIKPETLAAHIARVHKPKWKPPKISSSAYTHCPFCNTKLRKDELRKHQVKWHADKLNLAGTAVVQSPTSPTPYLENHVPTAGAKLPRNSAVVSAVQNPKSSIEGSTKHQIIVNLPGHIQRVKQQQAAQAFANAKLRCVPCPSCAAPVRADRIQRHMLKVHKTNYSPPPGSVTQLANFSLQMVTCSKCGAKVRPELLARHFRKSHSVLKKKKKKRKKRKSYSKREPRLVSGGLPGLGKRR